MKTIGILLATVLLMPTGGPGNANAQTVTTLYQFCSTTNQLGDCLDGANPYAGLVQGSDGNFYGTTELGGTNGYGTVFKTTSQGAFTTLWQFDDADGYEPYGSLVQGSDGNFYGTTSTGGMNNQGTVFTITSEGTLTTLWRFSGTNGYRPLAGLVQGSDGNFYGTTFYGGTNVLVSVGEVFKITPQGTLTTLYSFCSQPDCADGAEPAAVLVQGSDGNFYGTTEYGGTNDEGTVFQITSQGTLTTLWQFCSIKDQSGNCLDGKELFAGVVEGSDGNFYGTTLGGGTNGGAGTVFKITTQGALTTLCQFGPLRTDGSDPYDGLVQGSDSNFYGTTFSGGTNNFGTVFELDVGLGGCGFSINPTNAAFGAAGGSGSVSVSASNGCAWTAVSNDGWITITSGTNGTGNGTVDYSVAANASAAGRSGTMTIAGQTYTVFEGGTTPCTYTLSATNANVAAGGGSGSVTVTAGIGCAWTAVSSNGFITITSGSSGTGNGTVHYTVAANTNTVSQTGSMTIAGQTFTVTESGTTSSGGCTYSIGTKTSVTLAAKGGKGSISVKTKGTDCAWTAVSNDPFITITSGGSGTGNGKVAFTVPGNTNTTAMIGTMTIAGQTFTVNQDAGGCTFKLSPKDGKLKAAGGSATVKVTPNFSDCDWTAVSNDSFITITDGASGTGAGEVTYTMPANTNTTALTGSITIAGETFTITQAGAK